MYQNWNIRNCLFVALLSVKFGIPGASYDDDAYSTDQVFEICNKKTIQVENMTVACDSSYTYYYGNGAKRNSPTCDYGDKATLSVGFYVTEDIDASPIYMSMSAYSPADEQLYLTDESIDLCSLVGEDCNYAGYYEFSQRVSFADLYGNETNFVPSWEISFSEDAEGGYDLGAVNIECGNDFSDYFDWVNERTNTTMTQLKSANFIQEYGILFGTCIALMILGVVLIKATGDKVEYEGENPAKTQLLNDPVAGDSGGVPSGKIAGEVA